MTPYRDRAAFEPPVETLYEVPASTDGGATWVGILGALAGICAVALVVTAIGGAPREIAGFVFVMPVGVVVFGALALAVHRKRGRQVRIQKGGAAWRLVVEGEPIRLAFPLRIYGEQRTIQVGVVPNHHVFLQCADASGGAVFFQETRGAIHGSAEGWLENGLEPTCPGPTFHLGGTSHLAELRLRIEQINETIKEMAASRE